MGVMNRFKDMFKGEDEYDVDGYNDGYDSYDDVADEGGVNESVQAQPQPAARDMRSNGGVLSGEGVTTVTANSQYTMQYQEGVGMTLPTPIRDGYTFGGWYDKSDFLHNQSLLPINSLIIFKNVSFTTRLSKSFRRIL